jgi:hypothetical protein
MVNQLTNQITSALETGDFERAEPMLADFFSSLETDLAQTPTGADRAAALQDAIGWMHRWLSLSRVMRSHLCEQIRMNLGNLSYEPVAATRSTVDFTG